MESYIVRIYRRQEKHPREVVGIVEEVEAEEKKAFKNMDELMEILASVKTRAKTRRTPRSEK